MENQRQLVQSHEISITIDGLKFIEEKKFVCKDLKGNIPESSAIWKIRIEWHIRSPCKSLQVEDFGLPKSSIIQVLPPTGPNIGKWTKHGPRGVSRTWSKNGRNMVSGLFAAVPKKWSKNGRKIICKWSPPRGGPFKQHLNTILIPFSCQSGRAAFGRPPQGRGGLRPSRPCGSHFGKKIVFKLYLNGA